MEKNYCPQAETYGNYASVHEAKEACVKDGCCSGVYAEKCDKSDKAHLCRWYKSFLGTGGNKKCIYKKRNFVPGW